MNDILLSASVQKWVAVQTQQKVYLPTCKVSLEMSVNRTEPHTDLEVYVTADPNSVVHLLAVDQSVLLIKTGNDVTPSQVWSVSQKIIASVICRVRVNLINCQDNDNDNDW